MFHYDNGLFLTRPRLAVDVRRRQPRGFISHAHADHMARHELAFATPATAALYRQRLGQRLRVREMPFREPLELGDVRLTCFPAGHCLGSALLLADDNSQRLLVTGDFKLGKSLTATEAELPPADTLVIESTFGSPRFRFPARTLVVEQLLETVHQALAVGTTPVVHAYTLGKAQEVTAALTRAGFPVLQHPKIAEISRVYEQCGSDLGDWAEFKHGALAGHVVITLPKTMRGFRLAGLGPTTSIAVTGWAIDPHTKHKWQVDEAIPFSDHADFDELIEAAQQVGASKVYTTHGPPGFDAHLRQAGFDAEPLAADSQRRLFD